ncbi:MAG: hypothetical protein JW944_05595 [Deltaproteobacteria bacterium]|nr:hypothetical protein [Deltaproteobacteria bacterium]
MSGRTIRIYCIILAFLWSFILASYVNAWEDQDTESRFKISGFGTFGIVTSGSDGLGFRRDMSQRDGVFKGDYSFKTDSLVGLQLGAQIQPKLDAVFQAVLKNRTGKDLDENSIEQAFLRYQLKPSFIIRVGRLPINTYILADYRNVGFAYLWARPAVEYYGRIPFTSFDGGDIIYSKRIGNGTLHAEIAGGSGKVIAPLPEKDVWEVVLKPVMGFNMHYEVNNWHLQTGYAYTRIQTDLPQAEQLSRALTMVPEYVWPAAGKIEDDLKIKGDELSYYSVGFTFDDNIWLVQSEIAYINSKFSFQPSEVDGYFSIGRCFKTIIPYLMYSIARPKSDIREVPAPLFPDPTLLQIQRAVFQIMNLDRVDQKSLAAGAKWDFSDKSNLKLQLDRTWIKGNGTRHWETSDKFHGQDRTINTISCNLNFIF